MSGYTSSYILVDSFVQNNNGNNITLYRIVNVNGMIVLSKNKLKTLISQGRVNLLNANNNTLDKHSNSKCAYEEFFLKYLIKNINGMNSQSVQKKLMYYPLMLDIIRVLKELSDFSHLNNEIKVFITDLLRMISVFFNYMRSENSDSLSVTNLFKKQLKYPNNFESYINRHNNMLQRIGINNTQYNDWKTTVNENPCAYDKINTMLYNIWNPIVNVNANNRKSIKCLLCILEDFFKNIKFSLMGWYMYTDYALNLGTACKKAVQTKRYTFDTIGVELNNLTQDERKKKINACFCSLTKQHENYIRDLNNKVEELNRLVDSYGEETKALLSALPLKQLRDLKVNEDLYKSDLHDCYEAVNKLFAETRDYIKKDGKSITKILFLLDTAIIVLNGLSNGGIVSALPTPESQVFAATSLILTPSILSAVHFCIEGEDCFKENVKLNISKSVTGKCKEFINTFYDRDPLDVAIIMYKLNKISYTQLKKRERRDFIFYNYNEYLPVLIPMLWLTTKNIDNPQVLLDRIPNYKVDETISDVSLDIVWCTMFLYEQRMMKITNINNVYRPTLLWNIFLDCFNRHIRGMYDNAKNNIKDYLKNDCKWYIDDNVDKSILLSRMISK